MKTKFIFFCAVLFLFSCEKERSLPQRPTIERLPELSLEGYLEKFEAEGKARGFDIDLAKANISGLVREIDKDDVVGQCFYSSSEIVVDSAFWMHASEHIKELVVFHELGHCYLRREHDEESLPDGTCKSMMRSGLENCEDNYSVETRDTYIDELFYGADL